MQRFSLIHRISFLVLLGVFSALNAFIAWNGIDKSSGHLRQTVQTVAATITGPFVGAVARDLQSCCLAFSGRVALVCAPVLIICLLPTLLSLPDTRWVYAAKVLSWIVGWLVWFGGGIFSYAHALG